MTTATVQPQNLQALDRANALRIERSRQRRALINAPPRVLTPALIHPTPELATYRLRDLFSPGQRGGTGLISGIHRATLLRVLDILNLEARRRWHDELRLEDLTLRERRRLLKELMSARQEGRRAA